MYHYIGQRGFDRAWLPHQSRLIMFNGTVTYSNNTARLNSPTMLLENGVLDLYGAATSYINNMPINGTFTNTVASATCHKTVTLQKTSTGYLYNEALSADQFFWLRPDGVELYIKQEGEP